MKNRIRAFGYAFNGTRLFIRENVHARIHLLAVVLITILGFWVGLNREEWIAVLICFALVLALEAINSAIEYLTDLVSPEYHELAKKTKDVAAAAVLVSAIFSAIIAVIIFVPKFI